MPAPPQTVVVIPTYNERENVVTVCEALLRQHSPRLSVIVVDDNSPDGTGDVADAMALRETRLRVLHRPVKEGLGPAYIDGLSLGLALGYRQLVTMDADLSHDPADVPRLVELVTSGNADVAVGSRWISGGGTRHWPLGRRVISRGGSLYARAVMGLTLRDATGGFKCFSSTVLRDIHLTNMRSSGYAFNIELTFRAQRLGYRIVERPIVFTERAVGHSKMSPAIMIEALLRVPALRWQATLHAATGVTNQPASRDRETGSASTVITQPWRGAASCHPHEV